jgi:hypothetical protein
VGYSRRTEPFTLEQLTAEGVAQKPIGILHRTVRRGVVAQEEVL